MRERAKDMAKKILEVQNPVYISEKDRKEIWKIAYDSQRFISEIAKK